jgi:hypothetical protein
MQKQNFKFIILLLVWLFTASHCFAECLHNHTEETSNQTHHHHHQEHQHKGNTDITPCEASVALPVQFHSKVLPDLAIKLPSAYSIKATLIELAAKEPYTRIPYTINSTKYFHEIAINTLLIANAPPISI